MNTRIATSLISAVAVLALPAVADAKVTKLTLTEAVTSETLVVDYPPAQTAEGQPPSNGDLLAGHADMLRGSKKVGSADFLGVITAFPLIQFSVTFTLPGGKITVVDVGDLTAKTQTYAIVGGTGRYAGARGVDKETRVAEGKSRDVFTIVT